MRPAGSVFAVGIAALLQSGLAHAQPVTYAVDPKQSELVVLLYKAGIAARMAHDHAIKAGQFSGAIVYDPRDITKTQVRVTIQAASLQADDPKLCKKYKIKNSVSESDRKQIEANLKAKQQLWVKKHKTITFVSKKVIRFAKTKATYIQGTFTMRGVSKLVSCLITLKVDKDTARGRCTFTVRQSDFGYKPYSAFLGAVRVQDRVRIHVDLVAKRPKKKVKKTPPKKEPL